MEFKQSLTQRIVIAFALMSVLVAGSFAVGIVAAVHVVEKKLTTIGLGGNLHRLLQADNVNEWSHKPEKDQLFYASGAGRELELPEDLRALKPGFQEVFRDDKSYYAMVEVVDGHKYVLLQDQQNFEERESVLFAVVLVGFVLSVALAILLGLMLARRVMAPVVRLATQVRHRDQLLNMAPLLSPDYAADEVGELAVSFDATLGRLHQALTREQLFTSDVSHELRTPLMVLASSCELLLASPGLDSRAHRQVERIARASEDMRQLVQTFLMLARTHMPDIQTGAQSSLAQVARELTELWRRPIEEKGLSLIFIPGSPQDTLYNATFLHAVMGNLLRNAMHYTEEGFIRLTLEPSGFVVEDSGIGIPEEKRQAMFQPFVRGDEQRGEGLGLGLSLVQRICQHQGWHVGLTSREPSGCRFEVRLHGVRGKAAASL